MPQNRSGGHRLTLLFWGAPSVGRCRKRIQGETGREAVGVPWQVETTGPRSGTERRRRRCGGLCLHSFLILEKNNLEQKEEKRFVMTGKGYCMRDFSGNAVQSLRKKRAAFLRFCITRFVPKA